MAWSVRVSAPILYRTHLVKEVLEVLVRERLAGRDNTVKVRLHKVGDNVHVFEIDRVGRERNDVLDRDDILMVLEMAQQLDLRV